MFGTNTDYTGPFKKTLMAQPLNGRKGGSEYGGHIILPDNILTELISREIQYPMLFKLQVEGTKRSVYCGVTEFTAPSGLVYLPQWMMNQLEIRSGQEITLFNVMLQLGSYLLIRPHSYKFVQTYSDPKTILEQHITKYPTLTKGTTIQICVSDQVWSFDIMDLKPARAVCILNTDLNLDFDEPLDIKEYENQLKAEAEQRKINAQFAQTASEFHDISPATPQIKPTSPGISSPGYQVDTPLGFGDNKQDDNADVTAADNGVSIFAQNSDDEEGEAQKQRFGGGNSIKRGVVNHSISRPLTTPTNNTRTTTTGNNPIFANRTAAPVITTANPDEMTEEERKKIRAELARQQRAALFGKKTPATTTTTTTTGAAKTTTPALNSEQAAAILGTNKQQQGVMALNTNKNIDISKAKTVREGNWLLYYDEKGVLYKREDMSNSFSNSISKGVGNSIKKD